MRIVNKAQVAKFQQGGQVAPLQDPAAQGGGDPIMQLAEMSMQALQSQDCNIAMQVCEAFVALVQQASAPQGPVGSPGEGTPQFKRGGKMIGRKNPKKEAVDKLKMGGKGKC